MTQKIPRYYPLWTYGKPHLPSTMKIVNGMILALKYQVGSTKEVKEIIKTLKSKPYRVYDFVRVKKFKKCITSSCRSPKIQYAIYAGNNDAGRKK
jgi:hypothetical protein